MQEGRLGESDDEHADGDDTSVKRLLWVVGSIAVDERQEPSEKLWLDESHGVLDEFEDGGCEEGCPEGAQDGDGEARAAPKATSVDR